MRGVRLVTLSSDVGAAYAAQMKAVLAHLVPPGHVVDLAHDLEPHAIREAAFLVRAMAGGFPAGTVHVVVVDPGVGGRRAPIAIRCRDGSTLVGPNNGVLAPLAARLGGGRGYRLDPARLGAAPRVGRTFDGRDLFAPAAGRLARGTPPSRLGSAIRPTPLRLPEPTRRVGGASGEVVHRDRFGNLITNIPTSWVPDAVRRIELRIARHRPRTVAFAPSYEALGAGRLGVVGSSFGLLELAVAEGSAGRRLGLAAGAPVGLGWRPAH